MNHIVQNNFYILVLFGHPQHTKDQASWGYTEKIVKFLPRSIQLLPYTVIFHKETMDSLLQDSSL